ncbi:MAG: secretin and TonB N-terminal domain-containing protein [Sedimentisphaerales bacterium]|nr:secretin and TonB N-terminal domain-containing protein [Sedimentisphaerales bacterium]
MTNKDKGRVLSGDGITACLAIVLALCSTAMPFIGTVKKFKVSGSAGEPGVVLRGFPGATIQSDSSGYFEVEVPYGWTGTIIPEKPGFAFEPSSRVIPPVKSDVTGIDFVPQVQTFLISGSVDMPGVALDGFPELVTSDANGLYKAVVPYGWTGTVTPVKDGYEFTPPRRQYTVGISRNMTNESYKAAPITYEISGTVSVSGTPLAGVVMQGLPGNPITSASGTYKATVPYHWSGTVTPTREGYLFDPPMQTYSNVDGPMTAQDYIANPIQYTISGNVGIADVVLKGLPGNVISGPDGTYTATVNHGWTGEVTPTLDGYRFDPPKRSYPKVTSNQVGQDYRPTEILVTIAGNTGVPGVVLEGLQQADGQPVISDAKGSYFVKVRYGWSGTVTPVKEGYSFKPENRSYTRISRDMLAESYTATKIRLVISGSVGMPDVVLKGFPSRVVTVGPRGTYTTQVDYGWSGTVTPERAGYEFDPPSRQYLDVRQNMTDQDYVASEKRFKITGRIIGDTGPVEGVTVMTGIGDVVQPTVTGVDGTYQLDVPYNWTGVINLVKEGYEFEPRAQQVPPVTKDLTYDFKAKVKMLTITGQIIADGQPMEGVTITADNGGTTTVTDAKGRYKVQVPYGWSGNLIPTKEGIEFDPPSKPYENVVQDIDETVPAPVPQVTPAEEVRPAVQPAVGEQPPMEPTPRVTRPTRAATPEEQLLEAQIEELIRKREELRRGWVAVEPNMAAMPEEVGRRPARAVVQEGLTPEGAGPIITMTLVEEDLRQVLQNIATEANVTIVPDPEVAGTVSANIPGVPLEQALDIVLAGTGFSWKKTKHYYLVTSSKVVSPGFLQGSESRVVKLNYIDANEAVRMLSPALAPYVAAQTRGRMVLVTAPASLMDRVVEDLTKLDRRPRQVMLESKVVALEQGNLLNLGVEWAWPQARMGAFANQMRNATIDVADFSGKIAWGIQMGYSPDATFTNALEMKLNLLAENGKAQIMTNPQIFAQDSKPAEIRVVTEQYFFMTPPFQQQATITGFLSTWGELQTVESGTILTVTPHIGDNNEIMMEVAVELSDTIPRGRGSDLPVVTRRRTTNTVLIKDGGTVAIAGLTEDNRRTKEKKVPGLGDIPIIGGLFTSTEDDKNRREIAVFITARLVPETSTLGSRLEAAVGAPQPVSGPLLPGTGGAIDFRSQLQESLTRRQQAGY